MGTSACDVILSHHDYHNDCAVLSGAWDLNATGLRAPPCDTELAVAFRGHEPWIPTWDAFADAALYGIAAR